MPVVNVPDLVKKAKSLRIRIVETVGPNKVGHFGGSLSAADIVTALYFYKMKVDPRNPSLPSRDRFLLSKGHVSLVQYTALAELGFFPLEELKKMKTLGAMLQGHPDMKKTPGIEASTGSLGQGLSIANGMALGLRLDGEPSRVYVLMGDGELAEGQIWEAAMASATFKLDNLTAIIDKNDLQAMGPTKDRFEINALPERWRAFGWHVIEIDGHDMGQIVSALDEAESIKGKPTIIIAATVKGKGVSFAENNAAFHNSMMTEEQFQIALSDLSK